MKKILGVLGVTLLLLSGLIPTITPFSTAVIPTAYADSTHRVGVGMHPSGHQFDGGSLDPTYWTSSSSYINSKFPAYGNLSDLVVTMDEGANDDCHFYWPGTDGVPAHSTYEDTDLIEPFLDAFDAAGQKVLLDIETGTVPVATVIDLTLARYQSHPCVAGISVDVEWILPGSYTNGKPVTNTEANAWLAQIKGYNAAYLLNLVHWETDHMPPSCYDANLILENDGDANTMLGPVDNDMSFEYQVAQWQAAFPSNNLAYYVGYDEDYWTGNMWMRDLADPISTCIQTAYDYSANCVAVFWAGWTMPDFYYTQTAGFPVVGSRSNGRTTASDVTSHAITMPSGIVAGNLLLVVFSVDGNPTCTDGSGLWTKLGQASQSTDVTGAIFYKVATGGDTLTITTSNAQQSSHLAFRISGAGTPTGTSVGGSSTNSNPPNHNPGVSQNYLWIATRSGDSNKIATDYATSGLVTPANYFLIQSKAAAGTGGASTSTAERLLTASSENPGIFTSVNEQWVSWTLSIPPASASAATIATLATSSIGNTTATLNGNVTSIGSGNVTVVGFVWSTSTHNSPGSTSPSTQTLYSGNYTSGAVNYGAGQTFNSNGNVTGLTVGTLYYARAAGYNTAGWAYGSEVTFYTLPGDPSALAIGTPTGVTIPLTWTKGTNATNTVVVAKQGSYPSSVGDGTQIYTSTGSSTTHSSITCCSTWYYRAWAYNPTSGEYSAGYSSTTGATTCVALTVTTSSPSSVGTTSATLDAYISSTGSCTPTNQGFVWDTATKPPPGNVSPSSSGYGSYYTEAYSGSPFEHNIAGGLTEGTCLFCRGWAQSTSGYAYGSEISFVLLPFGPASPASTGHTSGNISISWTKGNGADNTVIRYSTSSYPTTPTSGSAGGNTTGTTATITGLSAGTLYYVSLFSWATESCGSVYQTTYATVSEYTSPGDTSGCSATADGTHIDLAWSKGTNADKTVIIGNETGFPGNTTDGTQVYASTGTSYAHEVGIPFTWYYAFYGYDSDSGYYSDGACQGNATTAGGPEPTPTPPPITVPVLQTNTVGAIGYTTATLNGHMWDTGGENPTQRGFEWGKVSGIYTDSYAPNGNYTTGHFDYVVSPLDVGTTYFFRPKAVNSAGWGYGVEGSFTTASYSAPTVTTVTAIMIAQVSADLRGSITGIGGQKCDLYKFEWGTSPATYTGSNQTGSAANYIYDVSNVNYVAYLNCNTVYYFRFGAHNSYGWTYGIELSFYTLIATAPSVVTNTATDLSLVGGTLQGNITSVDCQYSDVYGFEWGNSTGVYTESWTVGTLGVYFYDIGQKTHAITGYVPGATVYYRFKAHNSGDWSYADEQNFVTLTVYLSGTIREADGTVLGSATITIAGESGTVSDVYGDYSQSISTTGSHTVVISKTGYRSQTQSIGITTDTVLNFQNSYALIPDAPDTWYVLDCIALWQYPPDADRELDTWKVLDIIAAWQYPL